MQYNSVVFGHAIVQGCFSDPMMVRGPITSSLMAAETEKVPAWVGLCLCFWLFISLYLTTRYYMSCKNFYSGSLHWHRKALLLEHRPKRFLLCCAVLCCAMLPKLYYVLYPYMYNLKIHQLSLSLCMCMFYCYSYLVNQILFMSDARSANIQFY